VAEPRAAKSGDEKNAKPAGDAQPESVRDPRTHLPAELRNVSFPGSMRGYDRAAVDAYVRKVNRVIAELEVTRSPQAAVKHAVERVSEQTKQILEEARESAEQITATARAEGDEILAAAKAEAADLVVNASTEADRLRVEGEQSIADAKAQAEKIVADANAEAEERRRQAEEELARLQAEAEARMRELEADTATVWKERHELLGDIDRMAAQLHDAASAAAARFSQDASAEVTGDSAGADGQETTVLVPDAAAETTVDEAPAARQRAPSGRKKD
jgi:DivIVA domain-containing protein